MSGRRGTEVTDDERAFATLGAAVVSPSSPSLALRARLMTSMGRPGAFGVFTDRVARLFDLSLDEAAALLARAEDATAFQPWLEGVRMMPVRPGPSFSTDCVAAIGRLTPGARFPRHVHRGDELTLVMQGGFRNDRDGVEVWRGEELYERAGADHSFVVLDGEECVAAVLAVSGVTFD